MTTPDSSPTYGPSYSPDGLTCDDITALQRDVTAELRREGQLPPPRRNRRHRGRRAATSRPRNIARGQRARRADSPAARASQQQGEEQP